MKPAKNVPTILLITLLLAEIFIFVNPIQNYISLFYPRFNDQIQYLSESYLTFEASRINGFFGGIYYGMVNPASQGIFHDVFAFIFMLLFGPNRLSALLVNLFFFLGWQISTFYVIRSIFKSNLLGLFSAVFLLSITGIWNLDRAGSIFDYRLDHMAMCLFGITSMIQLKTNGFLNKKWAVIFGLFVGFTVLTRILTSIYFLFIFLFFFVFVALENNHRKIRLKNIFLSALVGFLVTAPFIIFHIRLIYEYYIVGHFTGAEGSIRDAGLTFLQKIQYEFSEGVIAFQGLWFYWIFALGCIPIFFMHKELLEWVKKSKYLLVAGIVFIASPMFVLALERQVSYVVLSILTPGIFLIALSILLPIFKSLHNKYQRLSLLLIALLSMLSILVFVNKCIDYRKSESAVAQVGDYQSMTQLISWVSELAKIKKDAPLVIGSDRIGDLIDAQVFRVLVYEQKGKWYSFSMNLPTGIFEESDQRILEKLYESDIFFITDPHFDVATFPYDKQMIRMYPSIKEYCDKNLQKVADLKVQGRLLNVYVSKELGKQMSINLGGGK